MACARGEPRMQTHEQGDDARQQPARGQPTGAGAGSARVMWHKAKAACGELLHPHLAQLEHLGRLPQPSLARHLEGRVAVEQRAVLCKLRPQPDEASPVGGTRCARLRTARKQAGDTGRRCARHGGRPCGALVRRQD
jgi:hypothetical protein